LWLLCGNPSTFPCRLIIVLPTNKLRSLCYSSQFSPGLPGVRIFFGFCVSHPPAFFGFPFRSLRLLGCLAQRGGYNRPRAFPMEVPSCPETFASHKLFQAFFSSRSFFAPPLSLFNFSFFYFVGADSQPHFYSFELKVMVFHTFTFFFLAPVTSVHLRCEPTKTVDTRSYSFVLVAASHHPCPLLCPIFFVVEDACILRPARCPPSPLGVRCCLRLYGCELGLPVEFLRVLSHGLNWWRLPGQDPLRDVISLESPCLVSPRWEALR